jgi:hypothetical protein
MYSLSAHCAANATDAGAYLTEESAPEDSHGAPA